MKIEAGKTYKTREGRKVRVICTDAKHPAYPVIGLMSDGDKESVETFTLDGKFQLGGNDSAEYYNDLAEEWREPLVLYAILDEEGCWRGTEESEIEANMTLHARKGRGKVVKLVEVQ